MIEEAREGGELSVSERSQEEVDTELDEAEEAAKQIALDNKFSGAMLERRTQLLYGKNRRVALATANNWKSPNVTISTGRNKRGAPDILIAAVKSLVEYPDKAKVPDEYKKQLRDEEDARQAAYDSTGIAQKRARKAASGRNKYRRRKEEAQGSSGSDAEVDAE